MSLHCLVTCGAFESLAEAEKSTRSCQQAISLICRDDTKATSVPKTAAERFKNAAAVLKARDVEDRRDYKERKRKQAAEVKAKKRAREAGDADRLAATLGPGLGFPSAESEQPSITTHKEKLILK